MTAPRRSFFAHPMAKWGLFMISLFVIWFAGWFAIAHFADGKIGQILSRLNDRGISIECGERKIVGFPFRLGVSCDDMVVDDSVHAYALSSGPVRSAAQLYAPRKNVVELSSPFTFQNANLSLTSQWDLMRLFVDAKSDGFELLSANWKNLQMQTSDALVKSDVGALHMRPNPQVSANMDVAGTINGLTVDGQDALRGSVSFDAELKSAYGDIVVARTRPIDWLKAGNEVSIKNLFIILPEGGRLALSGPLRVGENGMLNGTIRLGLDDVDKLAQFVTAINPEFGPVILGLGQGINMLGKDTDFGDRSLRAVPVEIKDGWTKVGFFKLGRLPPLF